MNKFFTKSLFFSVLITILSLSDVFGQTLTISNIDPGPYGPGSTIAIPFHVNDSGGCIQQSNVYSLYLCNASGTIIKPTPIDTIRNFYGTFFNYNVPSTLTPGNYTFIIKSSNPAVASAVSGAVIIGNSQGSAVNVTCPLSSIDNSKYPEVFGACSGVDNTNYAFDTDPVTGIATDISIFNESTQVMEVSHAAFTSIYTFTAHTVNYTVTVRSVNGNNVVSTHAYQLINNVVNTSIGATGNPSVCLAGGSAPLTYNIDISSSTGIQNNYPGNTYTFTWGDGSSSTYTLCQIKALNGQITHNYTRSSCGHTANNNVNSFEIDFRSQNNYCGNIGSAPSNYARVFAVPVNLFKGPVLACTGSTVDFKNESSPGPNPNASVSSCSDNPNAVYNWSVDGAVIKSGYHLDQDFVTTFTKGTHTITLHLQNPGACAPVDYSATICVQDPPKPSFTLPQNTICIGSGPLVPTNISVVDSSCNNQNSYSWVVSPSAGVSWNASAAQPQISFTKTGVYTISMGIHTVSCGIISDPQTATVVVNASPVAILSKDFSSCGKGQTFNFSSTQTNNPTYTILTGTGQQQPDTYTWNISGGAYNFASGNAHSQYPGITFNDYATYTITVTQQNSCGTVTSTQHITFEQAPTVTAGNDTTICAGTQASLDGKITGTGVLSYKWIGGTGAFTPSATSLQAQYQPSNAEISAGHVTLTLQALTSIAVPCNVISSNVTINITPYDRVTSQQAISICSNKQLNYTILGLSPGSTFTWTAKLASGNATGFAATGSGNTIQDQLINADPASTTNAVVEYTIIPYSSNGCPGTPFTLSVTVTPLPILTATVPNPLICSQQPANIGLTAKLPGASYTWTSTATGTVSGNSQQTAPISISGIQDILVNTGTSPAKVTYTITPYSSSGCAGMAVTAVINVQPLPVQSNAGNDTSICNLNSFTLKGNNPAPGSGKWTVVTGSGVTFANDTVANTTVTGLVPGNIYQFEWTITSAPGCQSQSVVTVTVNAPSVAGTTAAVGASTVCAGTNNGRIDLTGQTGKVLMWKRSTDNGATFTPVSPADSTTSLLFTNLTQTTQYEAVVQNGACSIAVSNATTITVNQPAITANAGNDTTLCNAASYTLHGNDPGTFAAVWRQTAGPPVTFADSTNYQTAITNLQGGNAYQFTWVIKAASPCSDSESQVVINDAADVVGSFTADKTDLCGSQTVTFTNTSNNQGNGAFSWNFGDGATSNAASPQHQFHQTVNGHDTTYIVTMRVVNNCHPRGPVYDTITVRPSQPIASILPLQTTGCTPFTITVKNTSPGNDLGYKFFLYNSATQLQEVDKTDKSDVSFSPVSVTSPTIFKLYMMATGHCGATASTDTIPITLSPPTVTPQMFIKNGGPTAGCVPFSTTFVNNSQGGSSYHYNIYDSNNNIVAQPTAGTTDFPYTFNTAGTFYVSISAGNTCTPAGIESPKTQIIVNPIPEPSFTTAADCSNTLTFSNTTPANGTTPASSLNYIWNFGDGSDPQYTYIPQPHNYNYAKSPFTVTLTATDPASGCSNVTTQVLNVDAPLSAEFTEQPDSITSIPNYHFSFTDRSAGAPVSWVWTFGDGNSSTGQDPEYTYPDTGLYAVKLVVTNKNGCTGSITHYVRITGVPGQLFLPNAFIPTSGVTELRTFMAKGSGIKTWHMQIYNNYGQLVWETTRLSEKGEPVDGWDGTFKGAPAPQGTYTWQVSAIFINGTQWKGMSYHNGLPRRTGTVNLIR